MVRTASLRIRGNGSAPSANTSDRKSTRLNSSHSQISYAVFCLKKKKMIAIHNHLYNRIKLFEIILIFRLTSVDFDQFVMAVDVHMAASYVLHYFVSVTAISMAD